MESILKTIDIALPNNIDNKCNFLSSLIFTTNIVIATYYKEYTYAILFTALLITSLIFHSNTNLYTIIIDKISIALIVLYGGYIFYNKCCTIETQTETCIAFAIIVTFLATVYLYCYGYTCNKYCFYEDKFTANIYHSILHFIVSLGHNLIILL